MYKDFLTSTTFISCALAGCGSGSEGGIESHTEAPDAGAGQACRTAGQIGPHGKYGITASCCEGLALRDGFYFEYIVEGESRCYADQAPTPVRYCLPCGDGVCDPNYEDKCLCPDDCGVVPEDRYSRDAPPADAGSPQEQDMGR